MLLIYFRNLSADQFSFVQSDHQNSLQLFTFKLMIEADFSYQTRKKPHSLRTLLGSSEGISMSLSAALHGDFFSQVEAGR